MYLEVPFLIDSALMGPASRWLLTVMEKGLVMSGLLLVPPSPVLLSFTHSLTHSLTHSFIHILTTK